MPKNDFQNKKHLNISFKELLPNKLEFQILKTLLISLFVYNFGYLQ